MSKLDDYIAIKEAARYLGVCTNTLRNWGASGKIKERRHPINNYRLYKKADLDRLVWQIETQSERPRHPR